MRTTIICGALMALALTTAGAQEDMYSVDFMLPHCKAFLAKGTSPGPQRGRCAGIVEALAYAMNNLSTSTFFCAEIPYGVTIEQEVSAVVRYIEAQQHRMSDSFKDMAFMGLRQEWPCPKPPLSDRRIQP